MTYHRRNLADPIDTRTSRQARGALGRAGAQWDARLWADGGERGAPNQSTIHGLSGRPLHTASVDAGWRMTLFDGAGALCEAWDGRGTHRWNVYDAQRRLSSAHQRSIDEPARCVERWMYGDANQAATNRCGRMLRQDGPAGTSEVSGHGLSHGVLSDLRRFLANLGTPDWPLDIVARDALLETDAQGRSLRYTTRWRHDALGDAWQHLDASGNTRRIGVDVAGRPQQVDVAPVGAHAPVAVVRALAYDAFGSPIAGTAGNGVVTTSLRSTVDGRLRQRRVVRDTYTLQDAEYTCDPVGNVVRIVDWAQPTTWFDGAQVDPVSTYVHDTLYQLVEASGRESVLAAMGADLPGLVVPGGGDASRRRRYIQTYDYDAGGNLRTLRHVASDGVRYTRTMAVAARSNRSLHQTGEVPPDFVTGFDTNGNQRCLDGRPMTWDARDRLHRTVQVVRAQGDVDGETYVYDGDGMRRRKVRTTRVAGVTHVDDARYLPGMEVHIAGDGTWEVISVPSVIGTVRWRHHPDQAFWRYDIDDPLGSTELALDDKGDVVSHEGYHPYGGTAWWAARSQVDAGAKTYRYSGKERDASGLYYYGYRYYAAWLCRWIQPDPAGGIDGLNRYRMVGNNPLTRRDAQGLYGQMNAHWADWEEIHGDTADARPGALWGDDDAERGSPHGFFDPFLAQRLAQSDDAAGGAAAFVADFLHEDGNEPPRLFFDGADIVLDAADPLRITSLSREDIDMFTNRFSPGEWTFEVNMKESRSRRYFANDIARYQYRRTALRNGFFGVLPPVIRRKNVVNETTLERTDHLRSGSARMRRVFLERTPNGKTTQRVLDDFGLHATAVSRLMHSRSDIDFLVDVRPGLGRRPTPRQRPYPHVASARGRAATRW